MGDQTDKHSERALLRVLGLPLLILYGVGVTVGAGIFVMIGTVVGLAGPRAPLAFLSAAAIAGVTAICYATLSRGFPRAAGASLYVKAAFGRGVGLPVGIGVALTGIVSSATIIVGFTGYVAELIAIPHSVTVLVSVAAIGLLVQRGVKESVGVAAVITIVEIGILLALIVAGMPQLVSIEPWTAAFGTGSVLPVSGIVTAAVLAFFAFIGFEDIVNMAEETVNPDRVMGKAILGTLAVTTTLYVLLALIAIGAPDTDALARSSAPLAAMWTQLTGLSSTWLSTMALIAVINGVIVQVIMASRLLYGMAREDMMPALLGRIGTRRTPFVAIWLVATLVAALALAFPIATLARATTTLTLLVFASVNLSLVVLGTRAGAGPMHSRRWIGILGFALTCGLALRELLVFFGAL
ncbi:APC family permease [Oceanibacterium hippocampi]|uniref:Putative amino acid permease YhdG n=1 Tax=Oceanibacterium hippocampi TaxID=745714 RepID=A0A1Y5TLT9_9PROT|nr:APC family permease [Oceanibacterium hippocampi]SLN67049.1 putative amino acid permease YhdG [Oceanibacterium hippocampi]